MALGRFFHFLHTIFLLWYCPDSGIAPYWNPYADLRRPRGLKNVTTATNTIYFITILNIISPRYQ